MEFIRDDMSVLTQPYPEMSKRFNAIKLKYIFENKQDPERWNALKVKYYKDLTEVMLEQFTELDRHGKADPWTILHHLTTSLDMECVPWHQAAQLFNLALKQLSKDHVITYEVLGVKSTLVNTLINGTTKGKIHDKIEKYIHAMQIALEFWNSNRAELQMQGVNQDRQFLENYCKMVLQEQITTEFSLKNDIPKQDNMHHNNYSLWKELLKCLQATPEAELTPLMQQMKYSALSNPQLSLSLGE